jgi:hypothetical protein
MRDRRPAHGVSTRTVVVFALPTPNSRLGKIPIQKGAAMPVGEIASRMLETYPRDFNVEREALARCIEACSDCAQACTQCADDCLSEHQPQDLVKCIRLNLDCADVCGTTARMISRQTEYDANVARAMLEACIAACRSCGDECERHGRHGMEHCTVCAEQCRRCEDACRSLLDAMKE